MKQAPDNSPTVTSPALISRLGGLARMFLKLGTVGFGGPQAHIAMINDEAVVRRNWMTPEQFTEGLAVCQMLPGPASTQMGIYTGYVRAGQLGALVAGLCFIAPAFLIVVALSWGYFRFQGLPQVEALFLGISPIVTAIVLGFCWKLGRKTLSNRVGWTISIVVLALMVFAKINVLLLFLLSGFFGLYLYAPQKPTSAWLIPAFPVVWSTVQTPLPNESNFWGWERISIYGLPLLWFFIKVGSLIFGGGLVIIPLIEFEVVDRLQWLTREEFINGVAIGQLSPGPVVLTAAFVGYKVAGLFGALTASIGVFFPSFAFVMLAMPFWVQLRQNPWIQAFLKGVTPAVLGAIAAASIPLAQEAIMQGTVWKSVLAGSIAIASLVGLLRFKLPTWLLILVGAVIGSLVGWLEGILV
ncbi:MAG: chromate efflux transporter [Cyanobacteria bacterium SID2]|nr:chromate efflux transporter [Cyanobacteria bacterium SID2]MBP0003481.1 chromate efflux transporter [Cyanobacteria bacterium SBC]